MRKRFRNLRIPALSVTLAAVALTACGKPAGTPAVDSAAPSMALGAPGRTEGAVAASIDAAGEAAPEARTFAARNATGAVRPMARDAFSATPGLASVDPAGAMLVRQGQASLEVKRVDDAVPRVRQAAVQFGGFIANASIRGGREETRAAALEVRVPSAQFDALVASLGGLGKVESVTATAQDVGDEYVDLAARSANAHRLEARLIEMLAARTGKLSDLLTMEQELARVREQIERYEGRLKHLDRSSALSTLVISLHEPLPLIERPNNGPIVEAFGAAWERALSVVAWCITSLGVLVPFGALGFGLYVLARWIQRRAPSH